MKNKMSVLIAAEALDMTTDELITALRSGKTLEELATEPGVDFQGIQNAIRAVRATEMRDHIQQALDDGTITQKRADWLLEGLDKGFLGGPGDSGLAVTMEKALDVPLTQLPLPSQLSPVDSPIT